MNANDMAKMRMAVDILGYYDDAHLSAVRADLDALLDREDKAADARIPDVEDWRFAHPAETAEETAAEAEEARKRMAEREREAIGHDREVMLAKLEGHVFRQVKDAVEYLVGEEGVPPGNIAAVCGIPEFSVRAILAGKRVPVSTKKIKKTFHIGG